MRAPNFMFEYQLLAAAGYAVVYCNARGCQGYGEAFCTAILGHWGEQDYADYMATVEAANAEFPYLDPERWAIVGGSYGGYLVNWAIGHTDRFRAAIADRSVVNRYSAYGTSDIGHLREFEYGDAPPWEASAAYLRQSPLAYLDQARTPTLVVHSALDLRCSVEQGEQLFSALKRLGAPVEFVRFPNESHELSRTGRPWHRVFRLERYLEWFQRWLQAGASSPQIGRKTERIMQ
jgi:dipeptidyl aminopeptidase/acylaminoacyl peptidase